ncbi:L-serine ammonia-lyase [Suttonella sp. R2A3]|uniref:L-serine ammonia-lyase n=1 Tax=Suttonella sp. R2A3 TaxID=2908648 RepID=UPI001F44F9D0|nr:L-serine ammonia-lyase [Suttonella sp. R2A3]UJF24328.1 L-serine ammonia-lyase [Suttonella sp. R2A3]
MISIYDMFKIGVGPSSSHTVGPMRAGKAFQDLLREKGLLYDITRFRAHVYGSLSYTGRGHGTDGAIIAGLAGCEPNTVDTDAMPEMIERIKQEKRIAVDSTLSVDFDYEQDFTFHKENLPLHENGLRLEAYADDKLILSEVYYSIGGGFIVDEAHFGHEPEAGETHVPYPYQYADDLLAHCDEHHIRLSTLMLRNECALHSEYDIRAYSNEIWSVMQGCIERGLNHEGVLPGKLRLPRRAPQLKQRLQSNEQTNDPMKLIDWVNMIAFAVNEENAAGGRVVTAPTNGACGIVPAVLSYYNKYIQPLDEDTTLRYFLACSAIGSLYKMNASISGAEVGCQGEVGVACSMAAGGLTDIMGGTAVQVCVAAEIAMEHHLGLTCDPLSGLVQVPCIERNAVSSIKAINASRMAMLRSSKSAVSLDEVIKTMYETGKDMHVKYRETSTGGLAKHVPC